MVTRIEVTEAEELSTAIAGLDIEYVRTDRGLGPSGLTLAGTADVLLGVGRMGFSATANTEIPDGLVVFGLITHASTGGVWCGTQLAAGQLFVFAPGTTFVAFEPAGLSGTLLIVPVESLAAVGAKLGLGEPVLSCGVEPVPCRAGIAPLVDDLWASTERADLLDCEAASTAMLESAVRALADTDEGRGAPSRRLDRRRIVSDCLEFAKSSGSWQVSMSELCHAANACESSVRQAFVEVFDMPPTQYFQFRLLSSLRNELLRADPREETVTRVAGSLGVTHLGRTSGRYRDLFGEVPSETLLATA
jgi:methylphosphotriester-DNA--protein-cysteine methyltransferase